MKYEIIADMKNTYDYNEDFWLLNRILGVISQLNSVNNTAFEISLYYNIMNYLRYINIVIYYNNFVNNHASYNGNNSIFNSYYMLLKFLDMIDYCDFDRKIIMLQNEFRLNSSDKELIGQSNLNKHFENDNMNKLYRSYSYFNKIIKDENKFKTPTSKYVFYLLKYTIQLEKISFISKVRPSFSELFYTDLGEIAFELFNKPNFIKAIEKKKLKYILDIGCGNGNFIDLFLANYNDITVFGVERQVKVCLILNKKYSDFKNVIIINDNINNLIFDIKFDLINISYMLFYMSIEDQKALFTKLYDILDENGSIIICQYFPSIENIQSSIAIKDKKWNKIERYKFKISNSILYSEVLLNDSLSDFNRALRFNEFEKIIEETNFRIEEIHKADNNYYSFYFTLTKRRYEHD